MITTIGNIMRKNVETIEELASVQEAAKKMKDKNVSSLIVVNGDGKPQGIVTERDLVRKMCINDVQTSTVTNKEIMSSLITIDPNSSPSEAADMMLQQNVTHLLVIDKNNDANKSVGIVTPLEFTRYQRDTYKEHETDAIEKILEYYV
jgi:CBS domain-containing protein